MQSSPARTQSSQNPPPCKCRPAKYFLQHCQPRLAASPSPSPRRAGSTSAPIEPARISNRPYHKWAPIQSYSRPLRRVGESSPHAREDVLLRRGRLGPVHALLFAILGCFCGGGRRDDGLDLECRTEESSEVTEVFDAVKGEISSVLERWRKPNKSTARTRKPRMVLPLLLVRHPPHQAPASTRPTTPTPGPRTHPSESPQATAAPP